MDESGPRRLAVIGYFAQNLGDDLFLRILMERYPEFQIDLVSAHPQLVGGLGDSGQVGYITAKELRVRAHEYPALVILGGSMFQQRRGWWRSWLAYARRLVAARRANVPIFVIGASFGPFSSRIFLVAYRRLFRLCTWISFRDMRSASLFEGLDQVSWYPDLAFAYKQPSRSFTTTDAGAPVAISVMEFGAHSSFPNYERDMAVIVESIACERPVKLLSFQDTPAISDSRAIARVVGQLSDEAAANVDCVAYGSVGIAGIAEHVADCSLVISTRFHSMVIGALAGRPGVAIGYHPKVRSTIEALDLDIEVVGIECLAGGTAVLQAMRRAERTDPPDVTLLAHGAVQHFARLDEVLRGG